MISRRYILRKDEIIWEKEEKYQESKFWLEEEDELNYNPNKMKDWSRPISKRQEGSQEWKLVTEIQRKINQEIYPFTKDKKDYKNES